MDNYKDLIERLKTDAEWAEGEEWENPICLWDDLVGAVSALTALTEENARLLDKLKSEQEAHAFWMAEEMGVQKQLRAELEKVKEKNAGLALALLYDRNPNEDCLGENEWAAIKAELRQAKRERDAAISDLQSVCEDSGDVCGLCKNLPCVPGNDHCVGWIWRGRVRWGIRYGHLAQ
uniref:Ead/Ea22-like family protein n=1 Tax=Dulem virus 33 TaxID=3145751 RepID=A0AAU8B9M1_9CAUD